MNFTTEEISLCKQVAEKHREEIKCGDWILRNGKLVLNLDGKLAWSEDGKQDIIITITNKIEAIPLWTISDCLEFLKEKGWETYDMSWICEANMKLVYIKPGERSREFKFKANTLLEACLKAVLAVLEEKK